MTHRDSLGFPHPLDTLSDVARSMRVALGSEKHIVTADLCVHHGPEGTYYHPSIAVYVDDPWTPVKCFHDCGHDRGKAVDSVVRAARDWLALGLALGGEERIERDADWHDRRDRRAGRYTP